MHVPTAGRCVRRPHPGSRERPLSDVAGNALSIRDEARQRLRLNRFLLASGFSLVYLLVLILFHTHGKIDTSTLLEASAIVVILIVTFFAKPDSLNNESASRAL